MNKIYNKKLQNKHKNHQTGLNLNSGYPVVRATALTNGDGVLKVEGLLSGTYVHVVVLGPCCYVFLSKWWTN